MAIFLTEKCIGVQCEDHIREVITKVILRNYVVTTTMCFSNFSWNTIVGLADSGQMRSFM